MIDPREVVDWLVQGTPGASGPQQVIAGLCTRLGKAGVQVHRMETFVRTLHPSIVGRSFLWTADVPEVAVLEQSFGFLNSKDFLASAMNECCRTAPKA